MIDESEFRIYQVAFPGSIKALVSMGEDNFYSIYVNSSLSYEEQKKAVAHELQHIIRDDFFNDRSIREVEGER